MTMAQNSSGTVSKRISLFVSLGLLLVALFCVRTISNSDFWLHLTLGRDIAEHGFSRVDTLTFTVGGQPYLNPSWLYDRILFILWQMGGAPLIVLAHAVAVAAAFALLIPVARKWASPLSIGFGLILCAWLMALRFSITASVFCLFFPSLFILVLSSARKTWGAWAVLLPAQVLWANCDTRFLLGPALCFLFAAEAWIARKNTGTEAQAGTDDRRGEVLGLLGLATLLVSLINPYGFTVYRHAFNTWMNPAYAFTQEWISIFSGQFSTPLPGRLIIIGLVIGALGLLTERRKLQIGITTLAVFGAFLVVRSAVHIDLFALFAFLFLCLSLNSLGQFARDLATRRAVEATGFFRVIGPSLFIVLYGISLFVLLTNSLYASIGSASSTGLGIEYDTTPKAASSFLSATNFPEPVINVIPDGGFLAWEYPNRRIFVDQRPTLYGARFLQATSQALSSRGETWAAFEKEYNPGAIVINCGWSGAGMAVRNLTLGQQWVLVYFDGATAILIRSQSRYASWIKSEEMKTVGLNLLEQEKQNYEKKIGGLIRPRNSYRLIGAGNVLMALGRYREAQSIYTVLAKGAPNMASAWLSLGICQLKLENNTQEALRLFEKAQQLAPKNALVWLWLSKACADTGQMDRARKAFDKGAAMNTRLAEHFRGTVLSSSSNQVDEAFGPL